MVCPSCGAQCQDNQSFCANCGTRIQNNTTMHPLYKTKDDGIHRVNKGRCCPRCGSTNYEIVSMTEGDIKPRGCLHVLGYLILTFLTCGIWIIIGLLRSGSRGKIRSRTIGVCKNCGYKFNV